MDLLAVDEIAGEEQAPETASDIIARLRKENDDLRAAVQARDDFISVAAHELLNAMTPLVGQISLLRKSTLKSGKAVPLGVGRGIERLDLIVRRYITRTTALLDIARLTSGTFRLNLAMIDASAAIAEVVADFTLFAEAAGSVLSVTSEPGIRGLFDRTALEEVAENLISNAVKYGGGKPIHVTLSAADSELCLQVKDHGFGISAADKQRIFQKFERLVDGRPSAGFGFGLWVVGQLVGAMGGRIEVESQPNQGSAFIVRLPLHVIEGRS